MKLLSILIGAVAVAISGCSSTTEITASRPVEAVGRVVIPLPVSEAEQGRFPQVEIVNLFLPEGESNVRSSIGLAENVGLIGTEETGDMFKTEDGGMTWRKILDGGDAWGIMDVRNFIRAQDNSLYLTTSEPGIVCHSVDEGETWRIVAAGRGSRTVGIAQLDNGAILVGIRRDSKKKTSLIRSEDGFKTMKRIIVSEEQPNQNVTCIHDLGGGEVLVGVGYEASGKIYKSYDYGITWEKKADYPEARDMMWFFEEGDKLYMMGSGVSVLYVSHDGGESWAKDRQFWTKGFLGMAERYEKDGKSYRIITATDQRQKPYRHVLLISDDQGDSWYEWIELVQDMSGGASNIAVLSDSRIITGTGNHSAQGRAFTLGVK